MIHGASPLAAKTNEPVNRTGSLSTMKGDLVPSRSDVLYRHGAAMFDDYSVVEIIHRRTQES
jgi:hypothetical protein